MKKKKLTGKQIKFFINLISITIFAFSYFYVYTGFVEKTETANKKVAEVKQSLEERKKDLSEEETVIKNLEGVNTQIQEIMDGFPVKIAKEDNFMFIEQMEEALSINISSIDVKESTILQGTSLPIRNEDGTEVIQEVSDTSTEDTAVEAAEPTISNNETSDTDDLEASILTEDSDLEGTTLEGTDASLASTLETMTGMQTIVTMNFITTYNGFKELVEYIKDYPDKTVIDSVSVSYDNSTGDLTGSLVIKRFSLTGTGKVYEEPYIDDINIGTDNIFGTNPEPSETTDPTELQAELPAE